MREVGMAGLQRRTLQGAVRRETTQSAYDHNMADVAHDWYVHG